MKTAGILASPTALQYQLLKVGVCQGSGRNFQIQFFTDRQQIGFDFANLGQGNRWINGRVPVPEVLVEFSLEI